MSSICLETTRRCLPNDVLKKIEKMHRDQHREDQKNQKGYYERVPMELLNMEQEWINQCVDKDKDDTLLDLDVLEDMIESMRVWYFTRDPKASLQGVEGFSSMDDMIFEIDSYSFLENETWQEFRKWAVDFYYHTAM